MSSTFVDSRKEIVRFLLSIVERAHARMQGCGDPAIDEIRIEMAATEPHRTLLVRLLVCIPERMPDMPASRIRELRSSDYEALVAESLLAVVLLESLERGPFDISLAPMLEGWQKIPHRKRLLPYIFTSEGWAVAEIEEAVRVAVFDAAVAAQMAAGPLDSKGTEVEQREQQKMLAALEPIL